MIAARRSAVTLTITNTAVGTAVISAPDQPPMLSSICWRYVSRRESLVRAAPVRPAHAVGHAVGASSSYQGL